MISKMKSDSIISESLITFESGGKSAAIHRYVSK